MANVAIIGCGLIGKKRAKYLDTTDKLIYAVDPNLKNAEELGCLAYKHYNEINPDKFDTVIVSTPNEYSVEIARYFLDFGKRVLVEKPGGSNHKELQSLSNGLKSDAYIRFGYNHRFHPGIMEARNIATSGAIGDPMFFRAHYGHGGRPGYDQEWRAKEGELIDQGVHLIDLSSWFLSDPVHFKYGSTKKYFWNMKNDNAFMILENDEGVTAQLSVSCTEWKNTFDFTVYGKTGKINVNGLGGSYGAEKITLYRMVPGQIKPKVTSSEYLGEDESWKMEWTDFKNGGTLCTTLKEALNTLEVIEQFDKEEQ